ncbi:unnamed protein product, partial [Prorocentrum cordatum]
AHSMCAATTWRLPRADATSAPVCTSLRAPRPAVTLGGGATWDRALRLPRRGGPRSAKVRRRPATRAPRPRTAGRMPPESGPRLARGPGRSRSVLGLPLECQPAADQSSVRDAFVHP